MAHEQREFWWIYRELIELINHYDQIAARDHALSEQSQLVPICFAGGALLNQSLCYI